MRIERLKCSFRIGLIFLAAAWVVTVTATVTQLRTSFDVRVPVSPTPVTIAGVPVLVYELHLTNFAQEPLTLQRVKVLDANRGNEIADIQGEDLIRRIGRPDLKNVETSRRTVTPGMCAIVFMEIKVASGGVPQALKHVIEYRTDQDDAEEAVESSSIPVRREAPIVLNPPVTGGPWAAIYNPSWERGHRRVFYAIDGHARLPGRFAIDWIRLDANGRFSDGDNDQIKNWFGYGMNVLAAADGRVIALRDGIAESQTVSGNAKHSITEAAGNYIALDIGHEIYAFYEHLKPGSIRVKSGDNVRSGQVIASLGFTGDSTGPHLHFHIADDKTPLGAEGLPYVFRSFTALGLYESLDRFGSEPWKSYPNRMDPRRQFEFPEAGVVVSFTPESND